jgi:3-deoxy-D-manno-octulosonic-acid transferase
MILFYQISVYLYYLAIVFASPFNPKAKKWLKGRKNIFEKLKTINSDNLYWFHCASLGEFEQAKPIIEKLKLTDPSIKILLTFFSPSGYEIGSNYQFSDYTFYLPLDTSNNAKRFIALVKPKKAFFIKYEFWYHFLFQLNTKNIPTYLVSGVFRKKQLFFKWYGNTHRKMLAFFTFFFVQNEKSKTLLNQLGYNNVMISGDTRLDRVYKNSLNPETPPLVKKFTSNKKTLIVGSSWPEEEKIINEYIKSAKEDFRFIIAPHDVSPKHIKKIEKLIANDYIKYSDATYDTIGDYKILIIDNIGILANTYQFTDIAFIGGGYSGALHNVLEPASFGNVILFGPKHEKFHEAEELLTNQIAYEVKYVDDLIAAVNHLLIDDNLINTQNAAKVYIANGIGATDLILEKLSYN